MEKESIQKIIGDINIYIKQNLWLDFEVSNYARNELTIIGCIDTSNPHDIEINFKDILFVSLPIEWKTDTTGTVISLLEGNEAIKMNEKFHVEQGYYIFKFTPEDYPEDFGCYLGAKQITYKILR